jgi:hypothetical protein
MNNNILDEKISFMRIEKSPFLMKKATFKLQPRLQEKNLRVQAKSMYEPPSFYGVF